MDMRRIAVAISCSVLALAGILGATAFAQGGGNPECIEVSGQARYDGTGYLHIVAVRNGCDRPAACDVWTSVDAERHRARIPAGDRAEVITRRGSPAYEFTPHARCTLD